MRIYLINIFLWNAVIVSAQSDSIKLKGNNRMSFGGNLSSFTNIDLTFKDGFSFTTAIVIKKEQQLISIAPVWWIDKNKDVNFFKGGMLSYQFYPNLKQKRINFYFIYDLLYTFEKNEWEKYMNFTPTIQYNISYKSKWNSMKNQVGCGFDINIYKGFYINESMSIGVEFYNYRSKTEIKENQNLSSEYSSGNIFSNSNTSSFLKIGLEYRFEK